MYIAMMSAMFLQYLVHPYPRNYVPINVQRKKSAYITSNARIYVPTNQQLFDNEHWSPKTETSAFALITLIFRMQ